MANLIYNKMFERLASGSFNLSTSTLKLALVRSTYTPNKDHDTWSEIGPNHEVSGAGYTAGGAVIEGKTITEDDISDGVKFTASPVEWPESTLSARYAVMYDSTTGYLIACFDFGITRVTHGGLFRVDWNSCGIINFGQG